MNQAVPVEAVVFDMDGVLADSETWWTQIDTTMLASYGVTYRGELKQSALGLSYFNAMDLYKKAYGIPAGHDEMTERRRGIATEFYRTKVDPFPSTRSVLEQLRGMGLKIALATSSTRNCAQPFLTRHDLTTFFDVLVTGEDVQRGKPHPDIYLAAAHRLGIDPARCLAVEDALSGIEAAQAAGMRVIALPDPRFVDLRAYEGKGDFRLSALAGLPELARSLAEEVTDTRIG